MANILEENLKAFLEADSQLRELVGNRVAYNHVPQTSKIPYVYFQQTGSSDDSGIGDDAGLPTRFQFTIECWHNTSFGAKTLGRRVHQILNKYRGALGDQSVQAIFAESQSDDYVPRGIMNDNGFHGSFLAAEVVP